MKKMRMMKMIWEVTKRMKTTTTTNMMDSSMEEIISSYSKGREEKEWR
jgi:hypothetical protein